MPDFSNVDPLSLVPQWRASDAMYVATWFVVFSWLPGQAWLQLVGLRPPCRVEKWALAAVVGVIWCTSCLFAAGLLGSAGWYAIPSMAPAVIAAGSRLRQRNQLSVPSLQRLIQFRRRWRTGELFGLLLVAAFVVWHVANVARAVKLDEAGVRFYDAWYSDKFVNMSVAVSLVEQTPPRSLRMAGEGFPYHFFPHVWIAGATRATGVTVVNVFWFHAAALGVGISGLAVLALLRRLLKSYRWALVGLLFFGLLQFTSEARPLELSIPAALLGAMALERRSCGGASGWSAVVVLLWGVLPLYEVFHALTLLAGLGVWWIWSLVSTASRGELQSFSVERRSLLVGGTFAVAWLAVTLSTWGLQPSGETKFIVKNSFHDSYKHEWMNAARDAEPTSLVATLYAWKRGKAEYLPARATGLQPAPAGWPRRSFAQLVYWVGFVCYAFSRWLNLGVAGLLVIAVALRSRRGRPKTLLALFAAIAAVGFALPCLLTWGHEAGGRWWESPNIYRPTTLAYLLLVLTGIAAIRTACEYRRRPVSWLVLSYAAWQFFALLTNSISPPHSFHHVDYERLAALAFLRQSATRGDVVIHPWRNEQIRNNDDPRAVSWIYKRHFTLGSNMTALPMYYEGREDHLFIGGFINPDEVYRRRDLRDRFYDRPDTATVDEVLAVGNVRWVVADSASPAPERVQALWPVPYRNSSVTVYRAPSANAQLHTAELAAIAERSEAVKPQDVTPRR